MFGTRYRNRFDSISYGSCKTTSKPLPSLCAKTTPYNGDDGHSKSGHKIAAVDLHAPCPIVFYVGP